MERPVGRGGGAGRGSETTHRSHVMKTYQQLLAEAKSRVREIGVKDALALAQSNPDTVFLDVREPQEYNLGKIPRAVTISRGNLEKNVETLVPRDKAVVVYCANGNRSAFAAD